MARIRKTQEEDKMQMTSLIDVTFLILIFFMLLPFRSLEKQLAADLPKNKGLARTRTKPKKQEKIVVRLKRRKGETHTQVLLSNTSIGYDTQGFKNLSTQIARIRSTVAGRKMPAQINAESWVPYQDVIHALDDLMQNGVTNVTFRGAAPPKGTSYYGKKSSD